MFVHIIIAIRFKKFVPGVITSIIEIPICIYLLCASDFLALFSIKSLVISVMIAVVIIFSLIYILHRATVPLSRLLENYSQGE